MLLHSGTQFHPFSTLPWDDQYLLFPGMTNTLYTKRFAGRLARYASIDISSAKEENILGNVALSPPAEEEDILASVALP